MRERITMLIAVVLLAIVTATSYWYAREMRKPARRVAPTPGSADFIVDRIVLTQFDDSGQARYKLFSERLSHFSENDDIELVAPRLVSLHPNQPQVQATARRARITDAGEQVLMEGDVLITREAVAGEPPLQIRSERITVLPDEERFTSEVPAQIVHGDSRLAAGAMQYDHVKRLLTASGRLRAEIAAKR